MKLLKMIADFGALTRKTAVENAPVIFAVTSVVLSGAALIDAARRTPKYMEIREEYKETHEGDIPLKDNAEMFFKGYWRPLLLWTGSVLAQAASTKMFLDKIASIGALYLLSEQGRKELEEKTAELLGKEKVDEIKDEIAKDKLTKVSDETYLETNGYGDTVFWYEPTDRMFTSDVKTVENGVGMLNYNFEKNRFQDWQDLNVFWKLLGLRKNASGSTMGWDRSYGKVRMTLTPMAHPRTGALMYKITDATIRRKDDYCWDDEEGFEATGRPIGVTFG